MAAPRKIAKKAPARKAPAKKAAPRKAAAPRVAAAPAAPAPKSAPAAGTADLAGGLRSYLASIEAEVWAVTGLSEQIDALVADLNDLRDQQAKRLLVLDDLRASVSDKSLGAFLDSAIKPRKTRVPEVIPERLL
jgi:hypothetical protein